MADDKMKLSWDDLKSDAVEAKLRKQQAIDETRKAYESAPAPTPLFRNRRTSIWYNTIFYMTMFGFLGGLLGWGVGQIFSIKEGQRIEAEDLSQAVRDYENAYGDHKIGQDQRDAAIAPIMQLGQDNEYFKVLIAPGSPDEKNARLEEIDKQQAQKDLISHILFFGISGMLISLALGIAEPIVARNVQAAVVNGAVGAALGLVGGLAGSLVIHYVEKWVTGSRDTMKNMLAGAASWGALGLFLSIAPGLVIRNRKRLIVGMMGGLIGGLIGGALFGPVANLTRQFTESGVPNRTLANLVGLISIGVIAGLATGLIENAARSGWLRVVAGLIAGKQFVVYRNPTYIGSAPQCQIYLFRDPQVGRRHAAIHVHQGSFEIEDLPLGGMTLVNGKAVKRSRLRNGDRIEVGGTAFVFQEKSRPAA